MWAQGTMDQGRRNSFAVARDNKLAMRPFVKIGYFDHLFVLCLKLKSCATSDIG